ncbi:uncharacterized protein HaLaN_29105 [Haematococcus lacustris]|uniref:Uncharacterized protein n=1 Tax=Haematococcus lacustris TaxID=44745 RepID=A0A6A0AD76_HAELA|nr:uncharacterized protein HaLaN_29105 [Haematococcus lacustris]
MDAGRLRNLYTQAQLLVAELRALPLDNNRESFPRIIELVRLVKRLEDSAHDLTSDAADVLAQRAAWLQRATWLREECVQSWQLCARQPGATFYMSPHVLQCGFSGSRTRPLP